VTARPAVVPRPQARPSATGCVRVGISGWRYPGWRGVFYPEGLVQKRELEFASRAVRSIELNGSFYSLQRPDSYARWRAETPDDFVFGVKGPRYITHILRLRDVETALANFFASGLAALGPKLGPILWQLPPTLRYDAALVDAFLAQLPFDTDAAAHLARRHNDRVDGRALTEYGDTRTLRHALEVRHASFADPSLVPMLRRHGVAFVVADTGGRWPEFHDVTADFVYLRLHGASELYASGYSERELARWAARIDAWRRGGEPAKPRRIADRAAIKRPLRDVFCYFDNTAKEFAPLNARRLQALVDAKG
jgi:uncharacterized protein YecE (DUF72 family)